MKIQTACLFAFGLVAFSTGVAAHAGAAAKLVTYGDLMEIDRRLVLNGWSIEFYHEHYQERNYVRQGDKVCLSPDYAYFDAQNLPRELDILPMSGAGTVITKTTQNGVNTEIEWSEPAAWHGDYGSPARKGAYVLDGQGRLVQAKGRGWTLNYAYDLGPEPTGTVPSCYDLRLPEALTSP